MTVTQQVENILAVSRMARNSDTELLIIYLQKAGMNLTPHQVDLFKTLPSTETIRRVRQKIQQSGRYLADQKIANTRKFKAMQMQQNAPIAKPERIEQLTMDVPKAVSWLND